MAKSNAQRQREWRLRQKKKELCTYGGCENKAPMPHSLCDKHREEAREIRHGQVRQLRAEIEALRLENAELRGRLAELERRYAEASESSQILLRYSQLQRMYAELGGAVIALYRAGVVDRSQLPDDLVYFINETGENSPAPPPA